MKDALAKELRAELKQFVQDEISKSSGHADNKRKMPKMAGASSSKQDDGSDDDMVDASSQPASPRATFRPARARQPRSPSAPPPAQQDSAEHFFLIKLPEPVGDAVARKWFGAIATQMGECLMPSRTMFLPFHDYITVHFETSEAANAASSALRKLKPQFTTRASTAQEVGIIRDRPLPVQRRGRGLHIFYQHTTTQLITGADILRQLHRGRGAHTYTDYYAEHSGSGDVRSLFKVLWEDDPAAGRIRIVEVILHASIPEAPKAALIALSDP